MLKSWLAAPASVLKNYETSVAVMCFVAANRDGKYDKIIEEAIGEPTGDSQSLVEFTDQK